MALLIQLICLCIDITLVIYAIKKDRYYLMVFCAAITGFCVWTLIKL